MIHIFRHGKSSYSQGTTTVNEADDLLPETIPVIRQNADAIFREANESYHFFGSIDDSVPLDTFAPRMIFSSPYGRTLHTAKVIADVAKMQKAYPGEMVIEVLDELREYEMPGYELLTGLVKGGAVRFRGVDALIDASITNPQKLSFARYIRSDTPRLLNAAQKGNLPSVFTKALDEFETYESVTKRMKRSIDAIGPDAAFVVTHEALTASLVQQLIGNPDAYLPPGHYVSVSRNSRGSKSHVSPCFISDVRFDW